jgi:glycosyltransferase involved in cell wall biosynthesis
VPQLCEALAKLGVDTTLVTAADPSERMLLPDASVGVVGVGSWNLGFGVRNAVETASGARAGSGVVVHDNGIWTPFHLHVASAARRTGTPRVVSPRGALSPWALKQKFVKKRVAWLIYQQRTLADATALHATSDLEADEIRSLGFTQPIAVIPNGIDIPQVLPQKSAAGSTRTMLFLSRIHPKKGLLNLLQAWKVAAPGPEWQLAIAGPDEGGHKKEVQQLVSTLALERSVQFIGEIADEDKWARYASADVFVLPSFSENFGLVVAESLIPSTPAITTTPTPWHDLPRLDLGWSVDPDVPSLATAIRDATAMSRAQLNVMGERAARWARPRFSWNDIAARMAELYEWLTAGGTAPSFVRQGPDDGQAARARDVIEQLRREPPDEEMPS